MNLRRFVVHPVARQDIANIWLLVYRNDGERRADGVTARIEAFVRSLEEFPHMGRTYDERRQGLRSTGIPKLKRGKVVFRVTDQRTTVLRVGYLGNDVMSDIPPDDDV